MKFLDTKKRNPLLSLASGVALAYVFIYLLPKIAYLQDKPHNFTTGLLAIDQVLVWFMALLGLLAFYWLGWKAENDDTEEKLRKDKTLYLQLGGFCAYYAQLGYTVTEYPIAGGSALMVAVILLVHSLGINHGLRHLNKQRYDKLLRWCFALATFTGWLLGISIEGFSSNLPYWNAFIGGGIIITALREELPHQSETNFLPFLSGSIGASILILLVNYYNP